MIAYLDLDAFFAAVEQLDRPELRGKPVVVGGDPRSRGVVATASYEARRFGIRSAMSAAEALPALSEAIFVRPDMARYRERSRTVWAWSRASSSATSRSASTRATSTSRGLVRSSRRTHVRCSARCRPRCGTRRASRARSAAARQDGRQDRQRPPQARRHLVVAPGPRGGVPGPAAAARAARASAPAVSSGCWRRSRHDRRPRAAGRRGAGALGMGKVGRDLRERARGIDRAPSSSRCPIP